MEVLTAGYSFLLRRFGVGLGASQTSNPSSSSSSVPTPDWAFVPSDKLSRSFTRLLSSLSSSSERPVAESARKGTTFGVVTVRLGSPFRKPFPWTGRLFGAGLLGRGGT